MINGATKWRWLNLMFFSESMGAKDYSELGAEAKRSSEELKARLRYQFPLGQAGCL
jgi:hypothetical protein